MRKNENNKNDEMRDLIESYLGGLIKYGNLWGEYILSSKNEKFIAYVYLAHANAMKKKYQTEYTIGDLEKIQKKLKETPKCEILDNDIGTVIPVWKKESFLYLFSHAFNFSSPVCLGSSGKSLPIFLLPLSAGDREDAYFWASSYRNHDDLWLSSGELEIPTYKQMAEPDSGLSKEGRKICSIIEKKSGIPTYYYLHRYWGRSKNEESRLCPQCGKKWRVQDDISIPESFSNFAFQCKPCRLVSDEAVSFEDERHARIGEYKPKKKVSTKAAKKRH